MVLNVVHDNEQPYPSQIFCSSAIMVDPRNWDGGVHSNISHHCYFTKYFLIGKGNQSFNG